MREIVIDILKSGEIRIETRGFTGKACLEQSQFLKDLLGRETARQLTPAYYGDEKQTVVKHLPLCG